MADPIIQLQIDEEFQGLLYPAWLASIVRQTLELEQVAVPAEVSLVITGQDTVQQLNRDYRDLDEPTDVLSFALTETRGRKRKFALPPDGVLRLGDVIISYPQAAAQAAERGAPVEQEVALLVVHGVLHLLGYDHMKPDEEKIMQAKERAALERVFPATSEWSPERE